jgi:hypothetical protein
VSVALLAVFPVSARCIRYGCFKGRCGIDAAG